MVCEHGDSDTVRVSKDEEGLTRERRVKIQHLEHDDVRLCSIPNLPGTSLSLHWVYGLVGSPSHTAQY